MCDFCGFWQHCVCMGFLNLQDRRIPDGPFKCYRCGYPQGHEIHNFLRSHCIFRRTISYALQEGIDGPRILAKKLSVCQTTAKKFIDRLVREGFVEKSIVKDASQRRFPKICYKTIRTDAVKRAASEYFLTPIEENSQFKSILERTSRNSQHRRKFSQNSNVNASKENSKQKLQLPEICQVNSVASGKNTKKCKVSIPVSDIYLNSLPCR